MVTATINISTQSLIITFPYIIQQSCLISSTVVLRGQAKWPFVWLGLVYWLVAAFHIISLEPSTSPLHVTFANVPCLLFLPKPVLFDRKQSGFPLQQTDHQYPTVSHRIPDPKHNARG